MRLWSRTQFRIYVILVVCLTVLFYTTIRTFFQPTDPVTVYNVDNLTNDNHREPTEFTALSIEEQNQTISQMCHNKDVRRFIRAAPYITQKRLFFNNTQVCTCTVPKAGSTSIGRLMLMAEFPEMADYYSKIPGHQIHVTKGTTYSNTEKCSDKPGLSFFVTRDPYTRLFSAYVDKVFLEKFVNLAILIDAICNKRISKDVLANTNSLKEFLKSNEWTCDVTNASFEQFLYYVTKTRHLDPHYSPVSLLCNPCKDPVDYIFKQENLKEDAYFLLDYLNETVNADRTEQVELNLRDYVGGSGVENLIRTHYVAWSVRLKKNQCLLNKQSHDSIYKRLWEAMKMLGNIDEYLDYIPELFYDGYDKLKDPDLILTEFNNNKIRVLNAEERAKQRRKYLVNAYKSVSKKVLKDVQTLFQLDFKFFQYDINPPT